MKTYDQGSSLFWLLLSILACIGSIRLGIGRLHNPGMGFVPFGASLLLGMLSLTLFLQTLLRKEEGETESLFSGTLWKRILFVLIALLLYAKLMPVAGYLISTFLMMSFLFWILERQKVRWVLLFSFFTTLITYYVFSKWLNCQFPAGLFAL